MRAWFGVPVLLGVALCSLASFAATVGPPAGVYNFGTLEARPDLQQACQVVNGTHFNVFMGFGGVPVEGASSVLRSNGTGAVKFSTSLPFDLNEAGVNGENDYYYGFWAIMTFPKQSSTSGTITFDDVIPGPGASNPPKRTVKFDDYTQEFNAATGQLTFKFIAEFPNCFTLIVGSYEQ
jgi:hypothetical protein